MKSSDEWVHAFAHNRVLATKVEACGVNIKSTPMGEAKGAVIAGVAGAEPAISVPLTPVAFYGQWVWEDAPLFYQRA
jgi:hypothetical protein